MAKKSKFRGKVATNAKRQSDAGGSASYGYLNLPKGISVLKPEPDDRITMDLLPYLVTDPKHPDHKGSSEVAQVGEQWWKRPFWTHRNVGEDNDTVVCLKSVGKKCPICEYKASQMKDGVPYEETKALKASLRNLYIAIPLGHKKYKEEIHIFDISNFLFQELLNDEIQEDVDAYEIFPDLEQGLSVAVRFSSTIIGDGKPFPTASRIDFKEREHAYEEDILDEVPNLDEVLKIYSYTELERLFFEMDTDEAGEKEAGGTSEQETASSESRVMKKKKKKPEPAEEEAEEEEDVPDAEDLVSNADSGSDDADEKNKCIACQGTGKDSKGKRCRICKGSGEKKKEEKKKKDDEKCPHGHEFGKDCEDHDECDDCAEWSDCFDAKEGL